MDVSLVSVAATQASAFLCLATQPQAELQTEVVAACRILGSPTTVSKQDQLVEDICTQPLEQAFLEEGVAGCPHQVFFKPTASFHLPE